MSEPKEVEITLLLRRHREGDATALEQLLPFILDELKRLARWWLTAQHPSWQPTALVNELFLRLFDGEPPRWDNRAHFFNTASRQMRNLLIDEARRKQTEKRGAGLQRLTLDEALDARQPAARYEELLSLHAALQALAQHYPRAAKVVELRFFVGLDEQETAQVLDVTDRTVRRDWAFARGWLLDYLQTSGA